MSDALTRQTNRTNQFILQELAESLRTDEATIARISGRSTPLAKFTLMGKVAADGKWKPWAAAANDGSAFTVGIFLDDDIPAADLAAGDVTMNSILLFGARCDAGLLVLENSATLDTVVGTGSTAKRIRDILAENSLFFQTTEQIHSTY